MNPDESPPSQRPPSGQPRRARDRGTLPDAAAANSRHGDGAELAGAIGPGLARAAVAVKIERRPRRDLAAMMTMDAAVALSAPAIRRRPRDPAANEPLTHMPKQVKEIVPRPRVNLGP